MTQITMDHPSRGGFRELTAAEIDVVCGGGKHDREDCVATWTAYGAVWGALAFEGPWGSIFGGWAGNIFGNHYCTN